MTHPLRLHIFGFHLETHGIFYQIAPVNNQQSWHRDHTQRPTRSRDDVRIPIAWRKERYANGMQHSSRLVCMFEATEHELVSAQVFYTMILTIR